MKQRKQSVIAGLDRIVSPVQASVILQIPEFELKYYYGKEKALSMRCLLKRICRSGHLHYVPAIGEQAYTLKGVISYTGMGRSWCRSLIERNNVRFWCVGTHYLYSKTDVESAWNRESALWSEWIPLCSAIGAYRLNIREVMQQISYGKIKTKDGVREQLVLNRDMRALWKASKAE